MKKPDRQVLRLDNRTDMVLEIDILLQFAHNLVVIPVGSSYTILRTSVPGADCLFYVVLRVMIRLDEEKHLFGFLYAVTVGQCVALLASPLFEDDVTILDENRGNLHGTDRVAALSVGISSAFNLDDRIHHRIPVET